MSSSRTSVPAPWTDSASATTTSGPINPDLIYTSISGFGQDGPYSGRRVYDNVIQAASGLASVQGDPSDRRTGALPDAHLRQDHGLHRGPGHHRRLFARATGRAAGQHIELAMLDTAIAFMWPDSAMDAALLDDDAMRAPTIAANYSITRLADGFAAASPVTDSEFRGLSAALGVPEAADDPRFADVMSRMANTTAMVELLVGAAAACTVEDFAARAVEHDVPASTVTSLHAIHDDPQVIHNQVFVERDHPQAGRFREPRAAARLSATPSGSAITLPDSASTPMRSCSKSASTPSRSASPPRSSERPSRRPDERGDRIRAFRSSQVVVERPQPATKPPAASARSTMPARRTVSLGFSPLTVTAQVTLSARSNTMECVLSTVPVCPTAPPP